MASKGLEIANGLFSAPKKLAAYFCYEQYAEKENEPLG